MKTSESNRLYRWLTKGALVALLMTLGVLVGSGTAFAAKGWVATDTYRVMNFSVLFIALFFLLKKPVSNALNARINGIKEQLEDPGRLLLQV